MDAKDEMMIRDATRSEGTIHLDLWYPDVEGNARYLQLGLMDVRAADDIRISYDKKRDGWLIEQDSVRDDDTRTGADDDPYEAWLEVAFIPAWGSVGKWRDRRAALARVAAQVATLSNAEAHDADDA